MASFYQNTKYIDDIWIIYICGDFVDFFRANFSALPYSPGVVLSFYWYIVDCAIILRIYRTSSPNLFIRDTEFNRSESPCLLFNQSWNLRINNSLIKFLYFTHCPIIQKDTTIKKVLLNNTHNHRGMSSRNWTNLMESIS